MPTKHTCSGTAPQVSGSEERTAAEYLQRRKAAGHCRWCRPRVALGPVLGVLLGFGAAELGAAQELQTPDQARGPLARPLFRVARMTPSGNILVLDEHARQALALKPGPVEL